MLAFAGLNCHPSPVISSRFGRHCSQIAAASAEFTSALLQSRGVVEVLSVAPASHNTNLCHCFATFFCRSCRRYIKEAAPFLNLYLSLTYVHLSSQKLTQLLTGALSVAEPHLLVLGHKYRWMVSGAQWLWVLGLT